MSHLHISALFYFLRYFCFLTIYYITVLQWTTTPTSITQSDIWIEFSVCVRVRVWERERGSERENNGVFQVEGQLLSLLLSIQQSSSLWRGLREALFRCCRGVDAGWLDASFQNHFLSKPQHMDDKLLYTSTTKVVGKNINVFFYWEQYENLRFLYRKTSF